MANVVIISAGAAAACVVLTSPPLRALMGMASRRWLGASLPVFLLSQTRRAWVESGQRPLGEGSGRREIAPLSQATPELINARGVR